MKSFNSFLIAVIFFVVPAASYSQPCSSGCTITVSTSTTTDYTISGGQQLCITSTGIINGNITLDGGTICNQGFIQSQFITINNGNFNNYGVVKYAGILELQNTSIFTNYSSGILKLGNRMLIHPGARYIAENGAQLLVLNPAPPIAAFTGSGLRTLAPDVEWVRSYGGNGLDASRAVIATKDGGCIFSGHTTTSANGDIPGVNHGASDLMVMRLDASGNIIWSKNYGNPSQDNFFSWGMYAEEDGGCLITGEIYSDNTPGIKDFATGSASLASFDIGIIKLDAAGNKVWTKVIAGPGNDSPVTVKRTADEGVMVCGHTHSNGGDIIGGNNGEVDAFAIKMNAARDIQWVKILGTTGYDFFSDFVELSNGDFVFSGAKETPTNDEDFLVVKVNGTNGNTIWEKTYGGTGEDNANNISLTEGGFVVSGYAHSGDGLVGGGNTDRNAWSIKIDTAGNIVWRALFGGSGEDNTNGQVVTPDNGIVRSGYSTSNDNGITTINDVQGNKDNLLLKYTANGELEWFRTDGTAPNERAWQMARATDGGFFTASEYNTVNGAAIAPGRGTGDGLITKYTEPPYAAFTGVPVTFTNRTVNGSTYQWKVNNVNVATTNNLTHTFSAAGTYTVSLVATNGNYVNTKNSKVVVSAGELVVDTRGLDTLILPDTLKYTISGAGLSGTYMAGSLQTFHPTIPAGGAVSTVSLSFETTNNQSLILDVDLTSAGITQNPRIRPLVGEEAQPPCVSAGSGCLEAGSVIKLNECFVKNCFKLNSTVYAILKRELDNGYFPVTNGAFHFKFNEEYNDGDGKLSLRIYDDKHTLLYNSGAVVASAQYNSGYGTHYYSIDLSACSTGVLYTGYFTIEVENEKKEVWKTRIKNERTGPTKWVNPCSTGPVQVPGGLDGGM